MGKLKRLYLQLQDFLFRELWRSDRAETGVLQHLLFRTLRLLFVLVRELASGQLNLRAMSLVYTTLLSLVPLLAVSFSVLKAFGVHNQVEPLLLNLMAPLGEQGNELVFNILGFVENMKVGVLGSLGLALLLYTVVSLLQKIEGTFNYVWHAKATRSLSRRFSDYLSVIMVGPVLVFSAIGMTASVMNSTVMQAIIAIEPFGSLMLFASKLMPFVFIIIAFTFVYLFVPNTKVRLRAAMVGAAVGGTLWQSTGMLFAAFASGSTRYEAIYSGFAIVILFMIWLYMSWLILLVGAQVAYYYQHPEHIRLSNQRMPLSTHYRERIALLVMYWVTRHFISDRPAWSEEALAQRLGVPGDALDEVLQLLLARGVIAESGCEEPEFLPLHDPAQLTVANLFALLREPDEQQRINEARLTSCDEVEGVMLRVDGGIEDALGGMTLKALALEGEENSRSSQAIDATL